MSTELSLMNQKALALAETREIRNYLSAAEVHQLLDACVNNRRDHLLINLLWNTGARISEALSIHPRDVDPFNHLITIRTLKKHKGKSRPAVRVIPVSADLTSELSGYLLQNQVTDRIFPITRVRAWQIIKEISERAGLGNKVHPHTLRHSFAVHLLINHCPISVVQDCLGHSSVLTSMVYLRIVRPEAQAFLREIQF